MYSVSNKEIGENYNKTITRGRYENNYEFNRWFITPRHRAEYFMTYRAIEYHTKQVTFTECLELGPGPGTWTRVLFRSNTEGRFTLVDVSVEMQKQFLLEMRKVPNVSYFVSDFMQFSCNNKFDYFFSSRAVEYLDDKNAFFQKLSSVITEGGSGAIVTKNPLQGVRKTKEAMHQGQITMPEMKRYLSESGFTDIKFFPVVIRVPIVSRFTSRPAEYIFEKYFNKQLAIQKTNRVIESYIVTFQKR